MICQNFLPMKDLICAFTAFASLILLVVLIILK